MNIPVRTSDRLDFTWPGDGPGASSFHTEGSSCPLPVSPCTHYYPLMDRSFPEMSVVTSEVQHENNSGLGRLVDPAQNAHHPGFQDEKSTLIDHEWGPETHRLFSITPPPWAAVYPTDTLSSLENLENQGSHMRQFNFRPTQPPNMPSSQIQPFLPHICSWDPNNGLPGGFTYAGMPYWTASGDTQNHAYLAHGFTPAPSSAFFASQPSLLGERHLQGTRLSFETEASFLPPSSEREFP